MLKQVYYMLNRKIYFQDFRDFSVTLLPFALSFSLDSLKNGLKKCLY